MLLASLSNTERHRRRRLHIAIVLPLMVGSLWAQLPDGPGRVETEKTCSQCHELERSISLRQDRAAWDETVQKMMTLGAKMSDADMKLVTGYLAAHYAADSLPPIRINSARSIELESGLNLKRSEAAAIIGYRTKNGPFKSIDDLKKVPGLDLAKVESRRDRLSFDTKP